MKPVVKIIHSRFAPFVPPKDNKDIMPLFDISEGGIALNDGTQGLQVQFWTFTVEGAGNNTRVYIEAPNYPKTPHIFLPYITWARGTFDQNMRPTIAFVSDNKPYLWWWDPVLHAQITTALPMPMLSPTVVMDDTRPRETQLGNNDIILSYMRDGDVYFRLQRDRYLVEYPVWYDEGFPDYIEKPYINRMGMNREWRIQLEIHDRLFDYPVT